MKKYSRLFIALAFVGALAACKKEEDAPAPTPSGCTDDECIKVTLQGTLPNRTLSADSIYILKGLVYVNDGATLTIPAGTLLMGDKASKAALVVNRGGKLVATGTAANPIIFTSSAPVDYRNYGDWGGIVMCGKAVNNQSVNQVVDGPTDFTTTTGNGVYGGTEDADNSGTLQYVRIEFAGISYASDKEINSLTLASVGSATTIDHIQVSYAGDDAYEWFGGTVNAKYLVAYKTWDDDFDTDFGFSGKIQFGVAMRDPNNADKSQSNAFETDNDGSGSGKTPLTSAQFSNISVMGPRTFLASINANYVQGLHVRRNSAQVIQNSIVTGYPTIVNFDKTNGTLKVKNNHFAKYTAKATFTSGNGNDTTGLESSNKFFAKDNKAEKVWADTVLANGNPKQATDSPALSGASFTDLTDAYFDKTVTYKGAMGEQPSTEWSWTSGWLNFTPQTTDYSTKTK